MRADVIGPDPATGIAVQLRSGAISGTGVLDADGRATLPLVDAAAATDDGIGGLGPRLAGDGGDRRRPGVGGDGDRETRERVRRWARARLDRPPHDAFLAEILASESAY